MAWALRVNGANGRKVSRVLGRSKDFLGYARRRRKKGASLEEAIGLVRAIGLPAFVVFAKLFPPPESPAELLRQLGQDRAAEMPPFLRLAGTAAKRLGAEPLVTANPPRLPLRHRLAWIDELRLTDPPEALRQLETELGSLLLAIECTELPEPNLAGDLAFALALWADLQRCDGRCDLAVEAGALALDFAERSRESWAIAHGLWVAALLVHELGHSEIGLPWLDRAAGLFAFENHLGRLAELRVCAGLLLQALGRREKALGELRAALERMPGCDHRWRHVALLELATAELEAGAAAEALPRLEMLAREHLIPGHFRAQVLWRRAAALLSMGEIASGCDGFGTAARLLARFGRPADAAFALCDFALFLVRQGHGSRASALVVELQVAWGGNPPSEELGEVVEDLFALTRLRELVAKDLEAARSRLQALGPPPDRGTLLTNPVEEPKEGGKNGPGAAATGGVGV
jgi:tetratricopeptide (TPR) repeat protein